MLADYIVVLLLFRFNISVAAIKCCYQLISEECGRIVYTVSNLSDVVNSVS